MGLKIRLARAGAKKRPYYHIVVADSRSPRDGRCVAQIGTYDPSFDPPKVSLQKEQAERWIGSGALPSPTVRKLMLQVASTA